MHNVQKSSSIYSSPWTNEISSCIWKVRSKITFYAVMPLFQILYQPEANTLPISVHAVIPPHTSLHPEPLKAFCLSFLNCSQYLYNAVSVWVSNTSAYSWSFVYPFFIMSPFSEPTATNLLICCKSCREEEHITCRGFHPNYSRNKTHESSLPNSH